MDLHLLVAGILVVYGDMDDVDDMDDIDDVDYVYGYVVQY